MDGTLQCLMLSTYAGDNANVIRDYLFSFNAYSKNRWYYIHNCEILSIVDFSAFDVITLFWSYPWPGMDFSEEIVEKIATSPALKVMFLQDEYRSVRHVNHVMKRLGVQVVCTCVSEADHDLFYPKELIPTLQDVHTVLTGYVPEYLRKTRARWEWDRPIEIGYRSRDLPFHLGDLAREKRIIAERFQELACVHDLRADISVREEDRIYGKNWLKFLRSCRCSLGTESGASVVDFSGTIQRECETYLELHPEATYEQVKERFFADIDGRVAVKAISPRVFEACAYRNTLIMHEGEYSGILRPHEHYIEVKKDYSNADEVIRMLRDRSLCKELAERAHRDLIRSEEYSYRTFVAWFDRLLASHCDRPVRSRDCGRLGFYLKSYWLADEPLIPIGAGTVRIPPLAGPQRRLRRQLVESSRVMQTWTRDTIQRLSRICWTEPWRWMAMLLLVGRLLLGNVPLLLLCLRSVVRRWPGPALFRAFADLHHLAVLAEARKQHVLSGDTPVVVHVVGWEVDDESANLVKTDSSTEEADAPASAATWAVVTLGDGDDVDIVWNYQSLGETRFRRGGLRTHLPQRTAHRFVCLPALFSLDREKAMNALRPIFGAFPDDTRRGAAIPAESGTLHQPAETADLSGPVSKQS